MKRISVILIIIGVFISFCVPCYAAESSKEVYIRYIQSDDNSGIPVSDGKAEIIMDDGVTISVTGIDDNAFILKVIPITSDNVEAWNWFYECINNEGVILSIYDIYFEDTEGNRINADNVSVTLTDIRTAPLVFSVTTSGIVTKLDSHFINDSVTFMANGSHYYMLVEKSEKDSVPQNEIVGIDTNIYADNEDGEAYNQVETGDESQPIGYFMGIILAVILLVIYTITKKIKSYIGD